MDSIYGAETDPIDSKLDLVRAYIDMGDDDGAKPVLHEVIKQGDHSQQRGRSYCVASRRPVPCVFQMKCSLQAPELLRELSITAGTIMVGKLSHTSKSPLLKNL